MMFSVSFNALISLFYLCYLFSLTLAVLGWAYFLTLFYKTVSVSIVCKSLTSVMSGRFFCCIFCVTLVKKS